MATLKPALHGRDHRPGGADPILAATGAGVGEVAWEDVGSSETGSGATPFAIVGTPDDDPYTNTPGTSGGSDMAMPLEIGVLGGITMARGFALNGGGDKLINSDAGLYFVTGRGFVSPGTGTPKLHLEALFESSTYTGSPFWNPFATGAGSSEDSAGRWISFSGLAPLGGSADTSRSITFVVYRESGAGSVTVYRFIASVYKVGEIPAA